MSYRPLAALELERPYSLDKKVVANPHPRAFAYNALSSAEPTTASRRENTPYHLEETEAQEALETEELRALTPPDRSESRDRITTQA